jgi:hypothetical protein
MPRQQRIPSYRLHKQSGQGIVTLTDSLGGRRDVLLGKYNTPAGRAEYARVLAEWEQHGRRLPAVPGHSTDITINEVMLAYLRHAEGYYVKDGSQTAQVDGVKRSIRVLRELYGHTKATDFGPLAFKTCREHMIKLGWCRRIVSTLSRQSAHRSPHASL